MSQISPPSDTGAPTTQLPRYRGVYGAVAAGLVCLAVVALIGGVAALAIWLLLGAAEVALQMFVRLVWFGAAAGAAITLSRLISKAQSDRMLNLSPAKGEACGSFGLFLGLLLAGYLGEPKPSVPGAGDKQPVLGQVMSISGPTLEAGQFDLADYRGKVVLVDFWASWCGPCVAELPNVREAYDKYHNQGLEVVAVSLDNERLALAKFLEPDPEPWPQVFFDKEGQRGFDNPLAKGFGVQAIPYLLVIGRDGKLVARNVRGRQIEAAVAEALGLPVSWSDRLAAGGWRLLSWLIMGVVGSPLWLLWSCILGGTVVGTVAELAARQALPFLKRRAP